MPGKGSTTLFIKWMIPYQSNIRTMQCRYDWNIKRIAEIAKGAKPRKKPQPDTLMHLSGLEPYTLTPESNFLNVGERTNVTGSKKFLRNITWYFFHLPNHSEEP